MLSIRQKNGPAKTLLSPARIRFGNRDRRPAGGRDSIQAGPQRCIGRENNHAVLVPGTASARGRIRNRLHLATCYPQLLQFSVGEEGQRSPVGGPERIAGAFGVSKTVGVGCTQLVDPNNILPCGFQIRDGREGVAVWSQSHVADGKRERRRKIHRLFWLLGALPPNRPYDQNDGQNTGHEPSQCFSRLSSISQATSAGRVSATLNNPVQLACQVAGTLPSLVGIF